MIEFGEILVQILLDLKLCAPDGGTAGLFVHRPLQVCNAEPGFVCRALLVNFFAFYFFFFLFYVAVRVSLLPNLAPKLWSKYIFY